MAMRKYSGKLGKFEYDDENFELNESGYLIYIGLETDGQNIKIPDGINSCAGMFTKCETLQKAPRIPDGVKDCSGMFFGCESLSDVPEIPSSVENCRGMFYQCDKLKSPPQIPLGVKNCQNMFWYCDSLDGLVSIPRSVTNCKQMFEGCHSLTIPPKISEGVKDCERMFIYCRALNNAPVVPYSVKNSEFMFYYCSDDVQREGAWNIEHRGVSLKATAINEDKKLAKIKYHDETAYVKYDSVKQMIDSDGSRSYVINPLIENDNIKFKMVNNHTGESRFVDKSVEEVLKERSERSSRYLLDLAYDFGDIDNPDVELE